MISTPRKAFVLAAGFGTRLLPLTREIPKPLLPLWNVPMLERTLQLLRRWGVRDILVNVHHKADGIVDYLTKRKSDGLRISISFEPEILGTGGALRKAAWFLDDKPFWLINADVAADLNPRPLLQRFVPGKTIASTWLHPNKGPRTVEMKNGFITEWKSKKAGADGTYTFCGLHLLSPRILKFLPDAGFASIITAYDKAMAQGYRVAGASLEKSFWADVGTPQQYLDAHRELQKPYISLNNSRDKDVPPTKGEDGFNLLVGGASRPRALFGDFVAVDPTARISPKAKLKNVVVLRDAVIPAQADVENAIVGRDVMLPAGRIRHMALRAVAALDATALAALREIGWPPENVVAQPMGPRGSARSFTRLHYDTKKIMLVQYDPKRVENPLYAGHARFLKRIGFPVPSVLLDWPQKNLTLFEDLGDNSLQQLLPALSKEKIIYRYKKTLDAVFLLHEQGTRAAQKCRLAMVPSFRPKLYTWEHDLFADHFLKGVLGMKEAKIQAIKNELASIMRLLLKAPRVLIHRDLQSSNIILHRHNPYFIDFQGMRYGAAVYDLASLICDPYVNLSEDLQHELVDYYARKCDTPDDIWRLFWPATVQRLGQALGAFGRLGELPDTRYFRAYIPPALGMMQRASAHLAKFGVLQDIIDNEIPRLMPKDH